LELLELNANIRRTTGKGAARKLRNKGEIPGILYGPKIDPLLISVNVSELDKVIKQTGQAPMSLTIGNGESVKKTAMVKELQTEPVSRQFIHVDFYEVAMDQKMLFRVPVEVVGKSPGAEEGGMLQVIRRELDVYCLPSNIPDSIKIDVSGLGIGDAVHVEEISLVDNIEIPAETNFTVVTVVGMAAEEVPEEEVEEGVEEAVEGEAGEVGETE
jgi:large subunit ribosomal protein L25